jgi:hypothetical protein
MMKSEVTQEVARNFLKGVKPLTIDVMSLNEPVRCSAEKLTL